MVRHHSAPFGHRLSPVSPVAPFCSIQPLSRPLPTRAAADAHEKAGSDREDHAEEAGAPTAASGGMNAKEATHVLHNATGGQLAKLWGVALTQLAKSTTLGVKFGKTVRRTMGLGCADTIVTVLAGLRGRGGAAAGGGGGHGVGNPTHNLPPTPCPHLGRALPLPSYPPTPASPTRVGLSR
jgi:hypothetical protein